MKVNCFNLSLWEAISFAGELLLVRIKMSRKTRMVVLFRKNYNSKTLGDKWMMDNAKHPQGLI